LIKKQHTREELEVRQNQRHGTKSNKNDLNNVRKHAFEHDKTRNFYSFPVHSARKKITIFLSEHEEAEKTVFAICDLISSQKLNTLWRKEKFNCWNSVRLEALAHSAFSQPSFQPDFLFSFFDK
jgi:hypothetical protein